MPRLLLVTCVLAVAGGTAFADKQHNTGHVSDTGKYSVVFPAKPSKLDDSKPIATSSGNLLVSTSKAEFNGVVYSVTFTDYPDSFLDVSPDRILDGVVEGMRGSDGLLSPVTAADEGKIMTRQLSITAGHNVVKARLILSGRRFYLVQVSGKRDAVKATIADEFLSSFNLTK